MDSLQSILTLVVLLALCVLPVECVELSFELEDNAKQCFYEDLKKGSKSTLEFQVGNHFYFVRFFMKQKN